MGVCREHAKITLASFLETGERGLVQSDAVRRVWEYIRVNQLTVGPTPALIKAEVPWSARRGTLSDKDRVLKTVNGILNKLTAEKFDLLKGQLIELKSFHLQFRHFRYIKLCGACPCCNYIALLSATVGLPNYGAHYDKAVFGIVGGPVKLLGSSNAGNVSQDLSTNQWTYKVGLNGEAKQFYNDKSHRHGASKWNSEHLVINKMMTWYKTTFTAPLGEDPVVVDLQGMTKGQAWVNGHSLGRYWPSLVASADGCGGCDYKGRFDSDKCKSNCGQPTQRWYHVPRSFLQDGENTLVLFEELGGDPSQVNFQTVTIGTICANTNEGNTLQFSCQGTQSISSIQFASFGDPQGTCGSFKQGTCEADDSLSVVQKACVGQQSCSIDVSEGTFGSSKCGNITRSLAVQAVC